MARSFSSLSLTCILRLRHPLSVTYSKSFFVAKAILFNPSKLEFYCIQSQSLHSFTFLPLPLRTQSRALHVMLVSRKLINSGRSYNCADLSITPCPCHAGCACVNYAILAILGRSSLGSQCYVYLASCPGFLSECIVESLTRIYICLVS